jgi:hypothetical protein
MATIYSSDLKLSIMATGENAGTWGSITNTNLYLLQQAIGGYEAISIAGGAQTTALTMSNGTISNARNAVIKLTGTITGNQIVTVPTGIEKTYIVSNGTVGAFTVQFIQAGGTGVTFAAADKSTKILFADGTNIVETGNTTPIITQINDTNVNEQIKFTTTASAVNEFTITNAATGNAPEISSTGGDTNIDLKITPKGSGKVVLDGLKYPNSDGSNGQVLSTDGSGNLAFTTISSTPEQLVKSMPLASGGAVTAGRGTFINSSGEVAIYPTVNTLGTVYGNSSADAYASVSNDGSRAIKISGTTTITITGITNNGTANAVNGSTTVTNTNSNFATGGGAALPAGNDKFMVFHFRGNFTFNPPGGFNIQCFIVTVDASGNCTKGNVVTLTGSVGGGNPYASGYSTCKITDDIFGVIGGVSDTDGGSSITTRTLTVSGDTTTATADTYADVNFFVGNSPFDTVFTSNNIIGWGVSTEWRTAAYTAGNIGTGTTTVTITDQNTTPVWYRITNSRVIVYYRDTNLLYKLRTYDVNQTTGALTLVDTEFLTGLSFASSVANFRFKDQTSGVFSYLVSGFYYANSISLDSSGNILGFNLGSSFGSTGPSFINYNASDNFFYQYYTTAPKIVIYDVNAYATTTPNYLGFAKTTDSTSPVDIVTDGVASGLTGLTAGSLYYLSTNYDGTVSTDSGSGIFVGKAISATEILLQRSNTQ